MIMDGLKRNSGALVVPAVYKVGKNMDSQARRMRERPDVFLAVYDTNDIGYFMPVADPLLTEFDVIAALNKLQDLWNGIDVSPIEDVTIEDSVRNRRRYHDYVMGKANVPGFLLDCVAKWYARIGTCAGTPVADVHGDATLENAMMHHGKAVWIDPGWQDLPTEKELDIGKLLQSVHGYHAMPMGGVMRVGDFTRVTKHDPILAAYYLATHIARLWPYQPAHHAWATNVAKEVLGAKTARI